MSAIHIKTAFSNIRRSPFQAMAAIFVLFLTFFMVTLLAILVYSSNNILKYFETRPQVIAFIKDDVKRTEVEVLRSLLEADTRVKDVKYVSKEQALSIYKEATSDNPLLSELVSPAIFPASLEFSLININFAQEVIDEISQEKIVDQIGFTASLGGEKDLKNTVERLKNIILYVKVGGAIFVSLLMTTSLLVLLIVISLRLTARRQEVEILDLIGATSKFIRSPIVIEAIIYALIGVLFGWMVSVIVILYSSPSIIAYFSDITVIPRDTLGLFRLLGIILAFEVLTGTVLAVIGSNLAVVRSKKAK